MTIKPCFAENAMIVSDDGAQVRFHPVCPKCGYVVRNVTGSGHCRHGSAHVGSYSCYKCDCMCFSVVLHRG